MKTLEKGQFVPQFCLLNQNQQAVSLCEILAKGKRVLIYFYPKALTAGCTTQACELRDHHLAFEQFNIEIIGISPDLPSKLIRFQQQNNLNFTLLSDPEHQVAQLFGVWGEKKMMGKVYEGVHRISFLTDTSGQIEAVFNHFKIAQHHQIILDYLQQTHTG